MRVRVILESPYAGDTEHFTTYAKRCMLDSIDREEAPMVSHLLYTQVLDDTKPAERITGIECGFAWRVGAIKTVVYTDYGISSGMKQGIEDAEFYDQDREYRKIGDNK